MAFLPIFAMPGTDMSNMATSTNFDNDEVQVSIEDKRVERAAKIEKYYTDRSMPLAKHSMDFVLAAEKYGIDWRLLPAIAVRESSGGKRDMNNNPFGWGSAKIKYAGYKDSIESVAKNLGGANPRTASYYGGKTNFEKLHAYNGTVMPSYPKEVLAIMDKIESVQLVKVSNDLAEK